MTSPNSLLRTFVAAALAAVAALAALASPASATSSKVTEYTLPAEFALPNDLVTGPDGAVWVTDSSLGRIWRISTKGKIRSYDLGQMPSGITTAGGSMWVADAGGDAIHRVETDGTSTTYPLRDGAFPVDIVEGAAGALWFSEGRSATVGRITTAGEITEYPLPSGGDAWAADIAAGPDGAVYVSEITGKVARVTMAGAATEYALPGQDALPGPIVAGPDGALYVSDRNNNTINRMTTTGAFTDAFTVPRENADPLAMVLGPDGALYISEHMSGVISRMTLDGRFTKKYKLRGEFPTPDALIVGPDGALWINQGNWGKVTRLDVGLDLPVTAEGTTFTAKAGRSATHTVATFTDADPNARARDYDVTISWGDGSKSCGRVRRAADGSFNVRGRHTYAKAGTRKVTVTITDGVGKGIDAKVVSSAIVSR
jgi:virginiamycin B lyase